MELAALYYFYVVLGEDDHTIVENFMGFSYNVSIQFFDYFMKYYLGTDDENKIREVVDKLSVLSYMRMIKKIYKHVNLSEEDKKKIKYYMEKLSDVVSGIDTLVI